MASYTVIRSAHKTLSSTTVDTVTLSAGISAVEVMNRSGTADLTVTVNGVTPVANADDTDIVVPGGVTRLNVGPSAAPVVKVLGSSNAYSVLAVI